jgi:hypothetical protein
VPPPSSGSNAAKVIGILAAAGLSIFALMVLAVTFLGKAAPQSGEATGTTLPPSLTVDPSVGPGGLPAGLYASPTGGPLLIDNASAGKVIEASWSFRLRALAEGNDALLTRTETGVQLRADLYTCGCDPPPGTPIETWSASAIGQTRYPATFLGQATAEIGGEQTVTLMVFVRTSAATPWKLQEMTGYTGGTGPVLSTPSNDDSLTQHPQDMPFLPSDITQLRTSMNDYWTTWATKGAEDPTSVIGGGAVADIGHNIVSNQHDAAAAGMKLSLTYHDATPSPPPVFPTDLPDGSGLLCGGTTYLATYTPAAPGGVMKQSSGADAVLPPQVPPGTYSRLVLQGYRSWCAQLTANHVVTTSVGFTGVRLVTADHAT